MNATQARHDLDTIERSITRKISPVFEKNRRIYEDIRGYENNRKNRDEMMGIPRPRRAGGVW